MRVLHVSDLHAAARAERDQDLLVEAMLEDARRFHDESPIDFAIVTGDLGFAGRMEDFQLAQELLLDRIRSDFGLPAGRIVLVPGNHDINRDRINRYLEVGLREDLKDQGRVNALLDNSVDFELATERLVDWRLFHEAFYANDADAPQSAGPLAWIHRLNVDSVTIGIAALNSAWRASGGEEDYRRLLLGDRQVHDALRTIDDADVRMVAMHHPLDWFMTFDQDEARLAFESRATIVFSGHEHVPNPTTEISGRGTAVYCRAGCLYSSRDYLNGYSIIDIAIPERKLVANLRSWYPSRGEFDEATNVAPRGVVKLDLPQRSGGLAVSYPSYTTVLSALATVAQRSSVVADRWGDRDPLPLDDLVVEPRFYPLPFEQAAAAVRDQNGLRKVDRANPLDALSSSRTVIVSGEPQSGVTDALLWIVAQRFARDAGRLAVYAPFEPRPGRDPLGGILRDAVIRSGLAMRPKDPLPPVVAAVDDVSSRSPKALERLATHISEHTESLYVLGCHGDEHKPIAEALAKHGVSYERVFLGPFGRRELRELVIKISDADVSDLVERVLAVLFGKSLPRSPFVMAALITVFDAQTDIASINESTILDAYANFLLGRSDIVDPEGLGMDYRRREHLLAAFAGRLAGSDVTSLTRVDAENWLLRYFADRGWEKTWSAGRVIDSLIRRRVLVEDEHGIGFRHPSLQDLFTGKWMLEEKSFLDQALSDWYRFAEAIEHAAALRRSDADLLRRVGESSQTTVIEAEKIVSLGIFDRVTRPQGWSADLNVERLERHLEFAARPDPSEEDLDAMYDELEVDLAGRTEDPSINEPTVIHPAAALTVGTALASRVLASSELVDDVGLKTRVVKQVIHGWGLVDVIVAIQEDRTSIYRELFEEYIETLPEPERGRSRAAIDHIISSAITATVAGVVCAVLGTSQLAAAIEGALQDGEFMASSAHALFATILYCEMRLADWPIRLKELLERHGQHPFIADLARHWALETYLTGSLRQREAAQLESLVADLYSASAGAGVAERSARRSDALSRLKQAKMRQRQITAGTGKMLDPLDEAEPHEPAGLPPEG